MKAGFGTRLRAALLFSLGLLALPDVSSAYPVRGGQSWALMPNRTLNACVTGTNCFPAQTEILVSGAQVVKFTGQYSGPTVKLNGANGYIFVATRSAGTVTYTTTVTDTTSGTVLATGSTVTSTIMGTVTCAQRGQNPASSAQPLLLSPATGQQLISGHSVEVAIAVSSTSPVNIGICVGESSNSSTDSIISLGGFVLPSFDAPTPACGSTLLPNLNGEYRADVAASMSDPGNSLSMSVSGVPSGAMVTPSLPQRGNPVRASFSWTPTSVQRGVFNVVFAADDEGGNVAQCGFRIDLGKSTPFVIDTETIRISPAEFPQKVSVKTVCRESVGRACLVRDIVEICVGAQCFAPPVKDPLPCRTCELEWRMQRRR